ncbi:uncharacterized protein [Rutidosis leptorrhynchoides]|uniref:uncharacterized protein isoform X2 n=1 Tax=Rutidosis leptorrhynchoides TaxID=125765 RepID=UPI003A98D413
MPGSVQVSVLDFKELPSSSNSVKVSLGKVEHDAIEKGTFSFRLTNLRDNLMITVHDSEGNQVSNSGIRTMTIIEKGTWDDVFSIEGGGLIHMKLQFILSDEERNRIRLMRESAMKKKQAEILGSRLGNAESAQSRALPIGSHEVSDVLRTTSSQDVTKDGLSTLLNNTESRAPPIDLLNKNETAKPNSSGNKLYRPNVKDKVPSDITSTTSLHETKVNSYKDSDIQSKQTYAPPKRLEDTSSLDMDSSKSSIAEKVKNFSPKVTGEPDKQGLTQTTPRNIKKMISVFESSMSQDRVPLKPLSTKSYRVGTLRTLKDTSIGDYHERSKSKLENSETLSSTRLRTSFSTGDLRKNLSSIITKEDQDSLDDNFAEPSEQRLQSNEKDPKGTAILPKDSVVDTNISVNDKKKIALTETNPKNVVKSSAVDAISSDRKCSNHNVESFEHDGSVPWIILGERRRFCTTAQGDRAMRLLSDNKAEDKGHQEKIVASIPGINVKKLHGSIDDIGVQDEETVHVPESITPENEDEDASNGSLGQAIKIALVVGFGVLVLLFRQREPANNAKTKENSRALKNQAFLNKRRSMEERRVKVNVIKLS